MPWGTADIFFPTDFDALCRLYKAAAEHVWGPGGTGYGSSGSRSAGTPTSTGGSGTGAGQGQDGSGSGQAVVQQQDGQAQEQGSAAVAVGEGAGGVGGQVVAEHFRQGAVMKRYREMATTATICAFNPMVDDFVNARWAARLPWRWCVPCTLTVATTCGSSNGIPASIRSLPWRVPWRAS